ncbi:MAG: cell wall-binding repeat-containing protein [Actinomycetota bacterium]|nr:cell wall-binding repeat-containing protein [Actinomycetota bacterium]
MITYTDWNVGTGERHIHWYDVATHADHVVAGGPWKQNDPAIYSDHIVFTGDTGGGIWDLYMVDISDLVPTANNITNTASVSERFPSLDGGHVVYQTTTDNEIWACEYDGSDQQEISFLDELQADYGHFYNPDIDDGIAVWYGREHSFLHGVWYDDEIYCYDFNRGFGFLITANSTGDVGARIGDGTVAWIASDGGANGCVRTYEFATDMKRWVAPGSLWQSVNTFADIKAGRVAWNDGRASRNDIYTAKRRCVAERIPTTVTDRYGTAAAMAKKSHWVQSNSWKGTKYVIIASGEDAAAADPLAAAGLCWTYDAPLLLTAQKRLPADTANTLKAMKLDEPSLKIIVVGGTTSVPAARMGDLAAIVGKPNVERLLSTGGRYDMAAAISRRMRTVRPAEVGPDVLFANGADPAKFFDALALSAISRHRGAPILLVSKDSVPSATANELAVLAAHVPVHMEVPLRRWIGGGPATISEATRTTLGVPADHRWYGANRYETAKVIAENATHAYFAGPGTIGTAAKIPDALAGGAMVGRFGGVVLVTSGRGLSAEAASYTYANRMKVQDYYVLGGTASVPNSIKSAIQVQLDR